MKNFRISTEAQNIVEKYVSKTSKNKDSAWLYEELAVSLYKSMPFSVLAVLSDPSVSPFEADIFKRLSIDEVEILQSEYTAVVKYCYERKGIGGRTRGMIGNSCFLMSNKVKKFDLSSSLIYMIEGLSKIKTASPSVLNNPGAILGQLVKEKHEFDIIRDEDTRDLITMYWPWHRILFSEMDSAYNVTRIIDSNSKYDRITTIVPPLSDTSDACGVISKMFFSYNNHLRENGEIYCIMPLCYLSMVAQREGFGIALREARGCSATIIELPQAISPYQNMEACLVRLCKDNKSEVIIVDLSESKYDWKNPLKVDISSILEAIHFEDRLLVWKGEINDFLDQKHLIPSHILVDNYLQSKVEQDERLIKISDLVEHVTLKRSEDTSSRCKYISVSDLSSKYMTCEIPYSEELETRSAQTRMRLKENCVLAKYHNGKMYVGYTTNLSTQNNVALATNILPFKIKGNVGLTREYLLKCLVSEETERQARLMLKSSNLQYLRVEDFDEIKIILPSLECQQEIFKKDVGKNLSNAERKLQEEFDAFREDMHMKKHAIGQTISNFSNWWDALQQARREGNGVVSDDASIGKIRKVQVKVIYDNLQTLVKQLEQQISRFDRGNGLEVTEFGIVDYINKYMERFSNIQFNYSFNPANQIAGKMVEDTDDIIFAQDALDMVLNNIISNACCHGFKNRDKEMNVVKIDLFKEGNQICMIVSNNGEPLHSKMNPLEVFVYGKTTQMGIMVDEKNTHYGIGGYEVDKLMREFDGFAEFISEPESEFPVSYKLTFFNTNLGDI